MIIDVFIKYANAEYFSFSYLPFIEPMVQAAFRS